jgi:hypothetical protein
VNFFLLFFLTFFTLACVCSPNIATSQHECTSQQDIFEITTNTSILHLKNTTTSRPLKNRQTIAILIARTRDFCCCFCSPAATLLLLFFLLLEFFKAGSFELFLERFRSQLGQVHLLFRLGAPQNGIVDDFFRHESFFH